MRTSVIDDLAQERANDALLVSTATLEVVEDGQNNLPCGQNAGRGQYGAIYRPHRRGRAARG
jgi:hypothetical protein